MNNKWLLVFCLLFFNSTTAYSDLLPEYKPTEVPDLELNDLTGKKYSLKEYTGTVVIINFWATWCPSCISEMPALQRIQHKFNSKKLKILAVNVNQTKTSVQRFVKNMNLSYSILMDSSAHTASNWKVSFYPTSYIIDKSGSIRHRIIGTIDWEKKEVIDTLNRLIDE